MFQLLIVDDEAMVVDGIADTLPWEEVHIGQVHKAYSARQALEVLERHAIDIVITDIRMPDMDGLQLVERIRAAWRRTRCLLLTGHAEFEYARQAVQAHAEDYLLKPASDDDLLLAVKRVVEQLEEEWQEIASRQRATRTLREHLPLLGAGLLNELLQGCSLTEEQLAEKLAMFEIPIRIGDDFSLLIVRLEEQFARYDLQGLALMEYALVNIAEEIFGSDFELWNCKDAHDFIVFLIQRKDKGGSDSSVLPPIGEQEQLQLLANRLQDNVRTYLKGSISVIVSNQRRFPTDVASAYREAVSVLRQKIGNNQGLFLTLDRLPKPVQMTTLQALYEPPLLSHLFNAGRWDEAKEKFTRIFAELAEHWSDSQEHLLEVFYTLSAAFYHIAHVNGKTFAALTSNGDELLVSGSDLRSIQQLQTWAFGILERIVDDTRSEMESSRATIVKQVQEYIESHLNDDVSLQAVADHIFLHPVYLSRLYKLETGEGISDYLYRLRMERAAYLVKHSDLKIYEITAEVGYQNAPYFIKVFRKHYGMTPQEYRLAHNS